MTDRYILDGKTPVPCEDWTEWCQWFGKNREARRVARDVINGKLVSTIFLAYDHAIYSLGETGPQLFETMVFADEANHRDIYMDRCSTWEEAEAMHASAVEMVKTGQIKERA